MCFGSLLFDLANLRLYSANSKFRSNCGWPVFKTCFYSEDQLCMFFCHSAKAYGHGSKRKAQRRPQFLELHFSFTNRFFRDTVYTSSLTPIAIFVSCSNQDAGGCHVGTVSEFGGLEIVCNRCASHLGLSLKSHASVKLLKHLARFQLVVPSENQYTAGGPSFFEADYSSCSCPLYLNCCKSPRC